MSGDNYTLEDLNRLGQLESRLEARACAIALRLAEFDERRDDYEAQLAQFRQAFADYQAAKAIADVAAGRSDQWRDHEDLATRLKRERLTSRMQAWLELIHRAERGEDREAELVKVTAHIAAEIANAVIPVQVDPLEVEKLFAGAPSKSGTPDSR